MTIVNIPTANPAMVRPRRSQSRAFHLGVFGLTEKQHSNINSTSLDSRANNKYNNRIDHIHFPSKPIGNWTIDKGTKPSSFTAKSAKIDDI
jgi:hypothetical protein